MKKVFIIIMIFFHAVAWAKSVGDEVSKRVKGNAEVFNMSGKYQLGRYIISPTERLVYGEKMVGGEDWDGYQNVPIKKIKFDTTSLIFIGNIFDFKEFFPIKNIAVDLLPKDNSTAHNRAKIKNKLPLSSLKVINSTIGYDNHFTAIFSPLESRVYMLMDGRVVYNINAKGYKHLRETIFKNSKGELFFVPFEGAKLIKISLPTDEGSLHNIADNYYSDKNGLYYFDPFGANTEKIESSNGKDITATLFDKYFIYGDSVYPYGRFNGSHKNIRLERKTFNYVPLHFDAYVGDKNRIFKLPENTSDSITQISKKEFISVNTPTEPFADLKYFDEIVVGKNNLKENIIYYPSPDIKGGSGDYYRLMKAGKTFYGVTGSNQEMKAIKVAGVKIFNADKNAYEPIEVDKFRRVSFGYYIYKDKLYYYDGNEVETDINLAKLNIIKHNGVDTEFYTDRKHLIGGYNFANISEENNGRKSVYRFTKPLFKDVDFDSLQIIDTKMMIDKNNIYQVSDENTLSVTQIKNLGLNVVISK